MPQRASHRQPDAGTKRRRSSDESDSLPDRPRRRKQPVREQHRKAVMQAIEGEIDPVTATTSYQAGLFIVAGAMVMMPLAYIALIGLLGYGIFWHVTSNVALVSFGFWGFVFYGLPLFVGPVVLLFMLKPLFAGQPAHQRIRYLKPEAEPFLYEYVEKLCHSVGAPPPASIRIDTDVNASASFRRGTFSRELTLTIACRWSTV